MTIQHWLVLLTGVAFTSAALAVVHAWKATNVRNDGNPVAKMLRPGARPGDTAGDALTYALIANDKADTAAKDVEDARKLNRLAAILGLVSAIASGVAGLVSALGL